MKSLFKLWNADKLAARVDELERENAHLKSKLSASLSVPMFAEVAKDFTLDSGLRDVVIQHAIDDLSPFVERSMIAVLKQVAEQLKRASLDGLGVEVPRSVSVAALEVQQNLLHIHVDMPRACTQVRVPFVRSQFRE